MANIVYDSFFTHLMDGNIDLNTNTIKCILLQGSSGLAPYTPSLAHEFLSDIIANEIVLPTTGYVTKGGTIAGATITSKKFDANDIAWTITGTMTAAYAVLYKVGTTDADSPLICMLDLGGEQTTTDGVFTVQFHSEGIFSFSV